MGRTLDDRLLDAIWDHDLARVLALNAEGVPLVGEFDEGASPFEAALGHDEAIATAIVDAGLDLGVWPAEGASPLILAALYCRPAVVRHLLARGADPKVFVLPTPRRSSALEAALRPETDRADFTRDDQVATVAALIRGGIPLGEMLPWDVGSVLDRARAQPGCGEALVATLEAAMDTAVTFARARGDRDARDAALRMASLRGNAGAVAELLAAGANVNAADRCGATALAFAVSGGHHEVMRMLLAAGGEARLPEDLSEYVPAVSPLHRALARCDGAAARLLLDAGAPVDDNLSVYLHSHPEPAGVLARTRVERAASVSLSPAVLAQIARLGGTHAPRTGATPREQAGVPVPEAIRSFLDDVTWPDVRYRGDTRKFFVGALRFARLRLSQGAEVGIGVLDGGNGWLLLRTDSEDPADPIVFKRDAEDGTESGGLPLSEVLASLARDE